MTTTKAAVTEHRAQWAAHGYSVPGRGKDVNEDHFWLPDQVPDATLAQKGRLYVVSDGVGGYKGGEVASALVVQTLSQAYYADPDPDPATSLQRAVAAANARVYQEAQRSEYNDMAATVVAAVVHNGLLVVANVGDSRAYRLRGNVLQQLSVDHTWVAERVASGMLSAEEADHHQLRHIITRSMGKDATVEPSVRTLAFEPGDVLLLGCDGLWEPLEAPQMAALLKWGTAARSARALVEAAVTASGTDDTTAVVVKAVPARGGLAALLPSGRATPLWALLGLVGILTLVALAIGILRRSGSEATSVPTPSVTVQPPAETPQSLPTAVAIATVDGPLPTEVTVATPTPLPATSTPTPVPTTNPQALTFCIRPAADLSGAPARDVRPDNCSEHTDLPGIPSKQTVTVRLDVPSHCREGWPLVTVTYGGQDYAIYEWRVGTLSLDGNCNEITDWPKLADILSNP